MIMTPEPPQHPLYSKALILKKHSVWLLDPASFNPKY